MKKYCYTFHQFFNYCEMTKQLTEYCNFTSLNPKKNWSGGGGGGGGGGAGARGRLSHHAGKRRRPKCSLDM